MNIAADSPTPFGRRVAAVAVLVVFAAAAGLLVHRLIGQLDYRQGTNLLRRGQLGAAVLALEAAADRLPADPDVLMALGNAYYRMSRAYPTPRQSLFLGKKAASRLQTAVAACPLNAEAVHRLAVATVWLERLQQYLAPTEPNPYDPLPLFEAAIRLWPNFISARLDLARTYYRRGLETALVGVARDLGRIHPASYDGLYREAFWNAPVAAAFAQGVRDALAEGRERREANMVLARLAAERSRWDDAVDYYQAGMDQARFKNTAGHYLTLGSYCLNAARFDRAADAFCAGLSLAEDTESVLRDIDRRYRRAQSSHHAVRFFQNLGPENRARTTVAILLARAFLDLAQPAQARQVLDLLLARRPTAEGFYWRAVTARDEQDWNAMELAAQKATVLAPDNSTNHHLFAIALARQKKTDRAEAEASLALKHTEKPNPWLHAHRAWIRLASGDYAGATRDWQEAIRIRPEQASFYAQMAETQGQMGNRTGFEAYYRLALARDPGNEHYRARLAEAEKIRPAP